MPLTESDYTSHESMWLYVIGWIVYLFMWSLIIGIAVWQISAQVDYNFSQVSVKSLSTAPFCCPSVVSKDCYLICTWPYLVITFLCSVEIPEHYKTIAELGPGRSDL